MPNTTQSCPRIFAVGALHVDEVAIPTSDFHPSASNPVRWQRRVGGVATNAARVAARQTSTLLVSVVGNDALGKALPELLKQDNLRTALLTAAEQLTGRYTTVLDNTGNLFVGLADVALVESLSWPQVLTRLPTPLPLVGLVDANLNANCLYEIASFIDTTNSGRTTLAAMTVSPAKAKRLLPISQQIDILFCNRAEAAVLCNMPRDSAIGHLATGLHAQGFSQFVISDGKDPLLVRDANTEHLIECPHVEVTADVNGAGDALAGATLACWVDNPSLLDCVVHYGLPAATQVLQGEWQAPTV